MWKFSINSLLTSSAIALNLYHPSIAQAQITPDNSLGNESTVVVPDNINGVPSDRLEGGETRGSNLFHSFQDFNVDVGRGAYFANPAGINNIFSRVTGTNISQINGTLGVLGNANLFLINPNGILFGENASLDLRGSFFASSAESLLFDDFAYSTNNPTAPPLLEINIPVGLNFRDNPGAITDRSASLDSNGNPVGLQVDPGQSLTLLGGELNFTGGRVIAPGGKVELGAVASEGTVTINEDGNLGFPENLTRGNVSFNNGSRIIVNPIAGGNAGNIEITAGAIALDGVSVLDASNSGTGEGNAGNISLQATGDISLVGSGILSNIGAAARGNVGEIILSANSISFTAGSQLQAGFFAGGQGNGTKGKITIQANDAVIIDNSIFFANNQADAIANSSDIEINARNLFISNGANLNVDNFGEGNAGNIILQASEDLSFTGNIIISSNIGPSGIGNVGNIELTANSISLTENSQLQAGFFAGGQGNETTGNISLQANDSVTLDSSSIFANNESGAIADTVDVEILANSVSFDNSSLFTANNGVGDAGNVVIDAINGAVSLTNSAILTESITAQSGDINIQGRSLLLTDNSNLGGFATENAGAGNATIQTSDFATLDRGSSISVFSSGTGGSVTIDSAQLNILNESSINAFVFSDLPAGNVKIDATTVAIDNNSGISLDTLGNGDAGSLELNTGTLTITGDSRLSSSTSGGGRGGSFIIKATDTIEITGTTADGLTASRIDASTSGSGAGGDIQINASNLIIRDGSAISAFATIGSSGRGGNINLDVDDTIAIAGFRPLGFFPSSIDVQSDGTGNSGKISIDTSNLTVSNGAKITTSTTGQGLGGRLDISATDSITVSGFIPGTGLGSQITSQSLLAGGAAGDIAIATSNLLVRDAGQLTVGSFSTTTSTAGNLNINADVIKLDNLGILNAQTFGDEGNIEIISRDIFLRGESNITTNAFGTSAGGNIRIDTENLVAFPNENSDISANAENSFGGRVNITTKGIFGTELREMPTPQSDITATSQLGAEFNGEVAINTPEVDPTSGLINLPALVGDATDQISQNPCQQGVGSEFIITGKGGLPPNINQSLNSESAQIGLIEPVPSKSQRADEQTSGGEIQIDNPTTEAVPAMGWIFNDRGEVTLTAYSTSDNIIRSSRKQHRSICKSGISP